MSRLLLRVSLAAVALSSICLFGARTGLWASFVSATTSQERVSTGTISIKAVACTDADDDWNRMTGYREPEGFTVCDGGSWQPCQPTSVSSPALASQSGFQSTSAIQTGELSDKPSELPTALPVLVSNVGTLAVSALTLSVSMSPVNTADSNVLATVLYGGNVVGTAQPLSALASNGLQLLSKGQSLKARSSNLIEVDLSSPTHNGKGAGSYGYFALAVTLAGTG